ncbi:hypothetical protein AAG906_020203 [Vitis piasezkii]
MAKPLPSGDASTSPHNCKSRLMYRPSFFPSPSSRGPFLAIDFASLPTHLASSVLTYIYRCMSVLGVGPRTVTPHLRKGMMESSSGISLARAEAFLRLFAILVLVLTACLLGFDTQTKLLFSTIKKTATFRDLGALQVVVYVDSVAAGYNLLQLGRGFISAKLKGKLINVSYVTLPWVCFLLDQAAVYTVFSANTAALQASIIAVTGESSLQWMKVCNRYTRFCIQVGGALLSGYLASLLMVLLSSLSAFSLFRLYSPKQFLLLKPT